MNRHNPYPYAHFDFLARSFAQMQAMGRPVDIGAVIGNMSDEQQSWFRERYQRYLEQATRAREKALS